MKALIAYATWYGATKDTAGIIAGILEKNDIETRLLDLEKEKDNIDPYDLIIIGSGIRMSSWNKKAEKFLKENQEKLRKKKVSLFVSAGSWAVKVKQGEDVTEKAYREYLEKKAEKYSLEPVSLGLFGGIIDFNKMSWVTRNIFKGIKKEMEKTGFSGKNGIYDTRDLDRIKNWARKTVEKT